VITLFNCHLKSKLGEHHMPEGAPFPPEADLARYDPLGRAMASLRSALRRMAEAWVLRRAVVRLAPICKYGIGCCHCSRRVCASFAMTCAATCIAWTGPKPMPL